MILGGVDPEDTTQKSGRGVRFSDTPAFFSRLEKANWDDIYLFREVAQAKSLRKASAGTGMALNTIRDRVTRLERDLDVQLFIRHRGGLRLTQDGVSMLELSSELKSIDRRVRAEDDEGMLEQVGQISLCVSEGIGAFWLTPRLQFLRKILPNKRIALHNALDQSGIHSSPHDLKIGFIRPSDPDVIVTRLATVHFMLCASEDYLREHGVPTSFDDADRHCYIDQDSPGLNYNAVNLFVGSETMESVIGYSVNSSFSLYWAVANGQGIGALPTYVRAISRRIHMLDLPVQMRFELWLSYDRSIRRLPAVRKAVDWLKDCFNPVRFPWFRDEFIHPAKFETLLQDATVVPLYEYGIGEMK